MLNSMRSGAGGFVAKVLMIILVASFAVWGITDVASVNTDVPHVAKVGDREISQIEFENRSQRYAQSLSRQVGGKIPIEQLQRAVTPKALQDLVTEAMFEQEFNRLNLEISDNVVKDILKNDEGLQTNGLFDRNKFQSALRNQRFTERQFLNQVKTNTGRLFLSDAMTLEVPAPLEVVKIYNEFDNNKKNFSYYKVPVSNPEFVVPMPTQEDLKALYTDNIDKFAVEETRSVDYISINPKSLTSNVEVTEEEIKTYYDANIKDYDPDFEVAKIEVKIDLENQKAEDILTKILDEVEAGITEDKPLSDIAALIGETVKNIPAITPKGAGYNLNRDFLPTILELTEGGLTDLLEDKDDYYLFEAKKISEARIKPQEEVSSELQTIWANNKKQEAAKTKADALHAEVKEKGFDAYTVEDGITKAETGLFSRKDMNATGVRITPEIAKTLFSVNKDQISEPIAVTGSNGITEFYIVAKLIDTKVASEVTGVEIDKAKSTIAGQYRQEILHSYTGYLQNFYDVKLRQDRLTNMNMDNMPANFKE